MDYLVQKNGSLYTEFLMIATDGSGMAGLILDNFTEKVKKPDGSSATLTGETYTEIGHGFYGLAIPVNFFNLTKVWHISDIKNSDGGCFEGGPIKIGVFEHNPFDLSGMALDATVAKAAGTKGTDNVFDAVENLGQGSGSETATIYAKETTTENPIPESYFEIWDESNAVRLYRDEDSDGNGTAVFNLAPGNYKIKIRKPFWSFPTSSDLTVPVGGTSLTVHATFFSPSAPPGPDLCVVYGFLIDAQNNKVSGATIRARLDNDEAFSESQKIADMVIETTSNSEGYFELALIPNSKISIEDTKYEFTVLKVIENYQWRKMGTVPDQDNANIEDVVS